MKRMLTTLAVLLLMLGVCAAAAGLYVSHYLDTPLEIPPGGTLFEVPAGASFATIAGDLEARELTRRPEILRLYARLTGQAGRVQAGEYRIRPGTTPITLLEQFVRGAVVQYSFTLIEGWNHRELLAALQAHPQVVVSMSTDDWPALLDELGVEHESPEGLFLPETYHFPRGTTDRSVLAQAYRMMQSTLEKEWTSRGDTTPVGTSYEALILASIVEKETGRADERQQIAGVFARRLAKGMRLQTDPTVIYGLGAEFDGNLTRRHLDTDSAYNTYTRGGLPPTPICMPGRASIHAALHPADGDALYFVATGRGDGSHKFSVTVEEHREAVQEYLDRLRRSR
jgi:UPF0755 protein